MKLAQQTKTNRIKNGEQIFQHTQAPCLSPMSLNCSVRNETSDEEEEEEEEEEMKNATL